jgi:hypothetical protein
MASSTPCVIRTNPPTAALLLFSEEFAGVLHILAREKGHLSPLLRCAWDSGNLRTLHRPLQATGAHISLIGHITQYELAHYLHRAEAHNGFANRCLWTAVRRSQCLPEGGSLTSDDFAGVAGELRRALNWIRSGTEHPPFTRDAHARKLWNYRYPHLSHARAALFGAATSRAEAQVLRLSAICAALDCSPVISLPHLEAALAVWDYCSASAALLFIPIATDPIVDRIREALDASPGGLTRDQIRTLFHRHIRSERIDAALEQLIAEGNITSQKSQGKGGPPPSGLQPRTKTPRRTDLPRLPRTILRQPQPGEPPRLTTPRSNWTRPPISWGTSMNSFVRAFRTWEGVPPAHWRGAQRMSIVSP